MENPCPICFQPQGDERVQHYPRCKYAHEEKVREEEMWRRIGKRNKRGGER